MKKFKMKFDDREPDRIYLFYEAPYDKNATTREIDLIGEIRREHCDILKKALGDNFFDGREGDRFHRHACRGQGMTFLNCPFCGGDKIRFYNFGGTKFYPTIKHGVLCESCASSVEGYNTPDDALLAWNKRYADTSRD